MMCVLGELHSQPPVKTDQLLNSLLFSYFLRFSPTSHHQILCYHNLPYFSIYAPIT